MHLLSGGGQDAPAGNPAEGARSPEEAFAAVLAAAGSRPLVTYYDEGSGERSELSARSLANWVAKTHHLLTAELGLGAGDTALVALPLHWISVPVLLGCLTAGLAVSADDTEADVVFVTPDSLQRAAGLLDAYSVDPAAAATGFGDSPPAGTSDYVSAVRPHEDAWAGVRFGAGPDDACLAGLTRAETMARARERAAELGLAPGARVLCTRDWAGPDDWVDELLAPLSVGGSVVYVRNATDAAILDRRATQEGATNRAS